jgi:hypothetical protein
MRELMHRVSLVLWNGNCALAAGSVYLFEIVSGFGRCGLARFVVADLPRDNGRGRSS